MTQRNKHFDSSRVCQVIYRLQQCMIVLAFLFLSSIPALSAEEAPNLAKSNTIVPEKIAGVTTVTAEQVIESLTSDKPPLLIDARIEQDRDYGYIENSISLPDIETNCDTLKSVSNDKNTHIMFYCNGVQCGRSAVSIKIARSCGYHKLSWFKGGFAEWKEKGYQYIKDKEHN